jgi:hypothetical protein
MRDNERLEAMAEASAVTSGEISIGSTDRFDDVRVGEADKGRPLATRLSRKICTVARLALPATAYHPLSNK